MTDIIASGDPSYRQEQSDDRKILKAAIQHAGVYDEIGIGNYKDKKKEIGAKAAYVADLQEESGLFNVFGKETDLQPGTPPVKIAKKDGLFNTVFGRNGYITVTTPAEKYKPGNDPDIEPAMTEVYRAALEDSDIGNVEVYDVDANGEAGWIDEVELLYDIAIETEKRFLEEYFLTIEPIT